MSGGSLVLAALAGFSSSVFCIAVLGLPLLVALVIAALLGALIGAVTA